MRKQRRSKREAAAERAWILNHQLGSIAMVIYILTDFCLRPSIVYLPNCARVRHWAPKAEAHVEQLIEEYFMGSELHFLFECVTL